MKHLTEKDYAVSSWSGGTTTQLAIAPEGAVYANRDFLWRISSATVDLEASDFTPLPDYERLITPLKGEMVLTHNGGAPIALKPYQVHAFSGADTTKSEGRCTDFNLMCRRGACEGSMSALSLRKGGALPIGLSGDTALLYAVSGGCRILCGYETTALKAGEAFLVHKQDGAMSILADADTVLMMAEIKNL